MRKPYPPASRSRTHSKFQRVIRNWWEDCSPTKSYRVKAPQEWWIWLQKRVTTAVEEHTDGLLISILRELKHEGLLTPRVRAIIDKHIVVDLDESELD